jgi:A/G-specific adenine glycosylase
VAGAATASGLLGGMAALPGSSWTPDRPPGAASEIARVRHVFTHFALELTIIASDDAPASGWWQPIGTLEKAGLPTLYRRAAGAVLAA